jgi:predicted type IV restriction endonuclease
MAFHDDLAAHAEQVKDKLPHVRGEESTKQALIVPLLRLLGYDVYDPREVFPEYTSDFAIKRSGQLEKVDYAILSGGLPVVFIECKAHDQPLEDHTGQLAKYFNATPSVRVAVITNGLRMKVFTDLQQPNIMDPMPWIEIDLLQLRAIELETLRKLRKADFSTDEIIAHAERTVYFRKMADFVTAMLREPSEAFVRFVASEVFPSVRLMPKVVERLSPILKDAIQAAVLDSVAKSFASPPAMTETDPPPPVVTAATAGEGASEREKNIVTTAEETRCFEMIAGWIREVIPEATVVPRDSQMYFAVHQGNVRTWFVRFNVQTPPYWIAFRHIPSQELKTLAPGAEVLTAAGFGDSRAALGGVQDVIKFRTALVTSYSRQAIKSNPEPEQGSSPGAT